MTGTSAGRENLLGWLGRLVVVGGGGSGVAVAISVGWCCCCVRCWCCCQCWRACGDTACGGGWLGWEMGTGQGVVGRPGRSTTKREKIQPRRGKHNCIMFVGWPKREKSQLAIVLYKFGHALQKIHGTAFRFQHQSWILAVVIRPLSSRPSTNVEYNSDITCSIQGRCQRLANT